MDWRRCEAGAESDVPRRIVILLFSLADLADLVAAIPARNRAEALRILLWGEAAARRLAVETALGGVVASDIGSGRRDCGWRRSRGHGRHGFRHVLPGRHIGASRRAGR